ncbi:ankyrin repeat and SOCS box protein 2-like isoform X2 [Toxotes jaculatrix]|uniref:ankyrin repeat and SOCS box protein 2-like isoform X2 n=1 Tax=Toxotes jaculatrix TaxID=941984 RepID=UPI001B3AABD2|nr:ankyrin repeat and SOCS box protein 2-like isoform X2 [Toxotes jaculatrix]
MDRFQSQSNMAVPQLNLDDYNIYSHLSDEELLQIAVERSLSDMHHPPGSDQTTSSSSSAPPTLAAPTQTNLNPRQRHPEAHRHRYHIPPSPSPPPEPPDVPNCANPPEALSRFLYRAFRREFSPLQCLIMNGDAEALVGLVRQRSNSLMTPNDEGWIALHEAAYYGQLQCVRILLRAYPDSVNRRSLTNQTALLLAAGRGHVSCVDFLLQHGADPNIANKDRDTPLFTACEHPSEAIVELLLRSGAQVNLSCSQGATALHEACRNGHVKLCRMLLETGASLHTRNIYGIQPFFTAAQQGHVNVIHLLAKKGADINGQAADGASPLYEACKNGHVSAVEALLSLKADANRSMKSGLLPLHVAVQNNHTRIVSMLITVTSRVRVRRSGISPLHIAAERNRDDILELLIESGFDINAELSEEHSRMYEDRRSTALYFSVYNGNLEAAEMLLEARADPNLDLFNPLLIAVRLGWLDMAKLLLRYGANANAQISTQPSSFPSAILLNMECLPMLKLLLDNGCDARPCFDCSYGQNPHPAVTPSRRPIEEMQVSRDAPPLRSIQFCEVVSSSSFCRVTDPIISMLLDYVSHVHLCSRLRELLDSCSNWTSIKLKALPPHPLMQLCRLKIRCLVGVRRLKLLHTLPLPVRLVRFLQYDVHCSLT